MHLIKLNIDLHCENTVFLRRKCKWTRIAIGAEIEILMALFANSTNLINDFY